MTSWRFWRRRAARWTWRPEFDAVLARHTALWPVLAEDERRRLVAWTDELAGRWRWEAARGFALDDTIRVVVAGQAALLVLGLGLDWYHGVTSVIVHPDVFTIRGVRAGPVPGTVTDSPEHLDGEAHHLGPVVLAWDAVRRESRHPSWGRNVVFHEFAHRLDMVDGLVDGTPPLGDQARLDRWVAVCTAAYEDVRAGEPDPVLRPYAGENVGEFFAVATEAFFCRPVELRSSRPELYGVLADFYRQDFAARLA